MAATEAMAAVAETIRTAMTEPAGKTDSGAKKAPVPKSLGTRISSRIRTLRNRPRPARSVAAKSGKSAGKARLLQILPAPVPRKGRAFPCAT